MSNSTLTPQAYEGLMGLSMLLPEELQQGFLGSVLDTMSDTDKLALAGMALKDATSMVVKLSQENDSLMGENLGQKLHLAILEVETERLLALSDDHEALIQDMEKGLELQEAYLENTTRDLQAIRETLVDIGAMHPGFLEEPFNLQEVLGTLRYLPRPNPRITKGDLDFHAQECSYKPNLDGRGQEFILRGEPAYVLGRDKDGDIWYCFKSKGGRIDRSMERRDAVLDYTGNYLNGCEPQPEPLHRDVEALQGVPAGDLDALVEAVRVCTLGGKHRGRIIRLEGPYFNEDRPISYGVVLGRDEVNDYWFAYLDQDGDLCRDFCTIVTEGPGTDEDALGTLTGWSHPDFK